MAGDRGPEIAVTLGVFLGFSWLFVGLRIFVRSFITKSWKLDDSLLVVSLALYTSYVAVILWSVSYGDGKHFDQVPLENLPKIARAWWFGEILYALAALFTRLSISVLLLTLSSRPLHKHIIYATEFSVTLFTIAFILLVIFQCSPVYYFWEQYEGASRATGSCIGSTIILEASVGYSAVGFTVDWILGLLPFWLLWNVKMSTRVKFSVAGVLSLGLLAGIATLIRIPFIRKLETSPDFLYATPDIAIWSAIEPGLGIIAFSGATLRPLLRYFFPHGFSTLPPDDSAGHRIEQINTNKQNQFP